ncbi:hypothetical protein MMC17_007489 [Xylographa soralifera]|nr:hypothetical protein [Xylographa soralifera]
MRSPLFDSPSSVLLRIYLTRNSSIRTPCYVCEDKIVMTPNSRGLVADSFAGLELVELLADELNCCLLLPGTRPRETRRLLRTLATIPKRQVYILAAERRVRTGLWNGVGSVAEQLEKVREWLLGRRRSLGLWGWEDDVVCWVVVEYWAEHGLGFFDAGEGAFWGAEGGEGEWHEEMWDVR